jgi:hypothetical protein
LYRYGVATRAGLAIICLEPMAAMLGTHLIAVRSPAQYTPSSWKTETSSPFFFLGFFPWHKNKKKTQISFPETYYLPPPLTRCTDADDTMMPPRFKYNHRVAALTRWCWRLIQPYSY